MITKEICENLFETLVLKVVCMINCNHFGFTHVAMYTRSFPEFCEKNHRHITRVGLENEYSLSQMQIKQLYD